MPNQTKTPVREMREMSRGANEELPSVRTDGTGVTEESSNDDLATCSKCDAQLDTTGFPKWCRACQNAYRKEYRRTVKDMSETRGFAAGASAMQSALAAQFQASGGMFNGPTAAGWVRKFRLNPVPLANSQAAGK